MFVWQLKQLVAGATAMGPENLSPLVSRSVEDGSLVFVEGVRGCCELSFRLVDAGHLPCCCRPCGSPAGAAVSSITRVASTQ
jgi:hypothetical protein